LGIEISYLDSNERFIFNAGLKKQIIKLLKKEKKKLGEVSIIFTSNKTILEINKQFLGHNYHTDVITFPNNKRNTLGGDIYISIDQVIINANKYDCKITDEILRVIIHGILHLVGYEDKTVEEMTMMRSLEDNYLYLFKSNNIIEYCGTEI
jgi:rRNA maturation RNase YbeY